MNALKLNISEKQTQIIIWTLLFITPIIGMAVDLVAPSLPAMAIGLNVSAGLVKDVITLYLLGYAFGNFVTGFLTDAWGRQRILRVGLIGFVLASVLPVIYPRIEILLFARFLQGFTIGAVAVVARAIYSDLLPPEKLVKMGVLMGSMFGLGPVVGPLIGGYLQFYFGWQACFVFFATIMLIMGILIFIIVPETHFNRHALNIKTIQRNIVEIIAHKKFMALVILMGAVYSLIIAFNTVGPFLIQTRLHYSPIFFGHIALLMGLVFLAATFMCRYLLQRRSVEQLYLFFINSIFAIAILAVVLGYVVGNSIALIACASAFMFFACGFIFPMSMGKGLSLFRHIAGTATAIMYLINILMTSLTAFILSFININSAAALFMIYVVLLAICVIVYWSLIHPKE